MGFNQYFEQDQVLELLAKSLPCYLKSLNKDTGLFGSLTPEIFNMEELKSSSPVIEYVVRPHINILATLAAFIYKDHFPEYITDVISKENAIKHVIRGLEWICDTHITGTKDIEEFLARKRWGENWRSGSWATIIGFTSFLSKNNLPETLISKIDNIIVFEANRFIDVPPPDGRITYSRSEENAQDVAILAWAINSQPNHKNLSKWKKSLGIWALNIATTIADQADHSEFMDHSVSYWATTSTLHPDLTAESHGYFSPETYSYAMWLVLALASYKIHGNHPPSVFYRKVHQDTFDLLLRFCQPNGLIFSPGSSDSPLFIPRPFILAWGLWNSDPRALRITSSTLNWMESRISNLWVEGLSSSSEGWGLFFQSLPGFELSLLATLPFPKEQKFFSMGQIENAIDTKKIYPYVELCYRRNTSVTRSLAWKALGHHPIVGINIHSFPELLIPFSANLLGIPVTSPTCKHWKVSFHEERIKKHGFDSFGKINYYDENEKLILSRELRVITWGDDGLIIFDRITAEANIQIEEQYLSPLYIVNDTWTDNKIKLTSGSLTEIINNSSKSSRAIPCPSFWASINDSVIVQFLWKKEKGLTYLPGRQKNAPKYWKNSRLDILGIYLEEAEVQKNEIVYETGFFVGSGKSPRPFKSAGRAGRFFKGVVIMDGKETIGLS